MKYYTILQHYRLALLEELVEKYLEEGWICQGGVGFAISQGNENIYCQAMVKP